MNMPHQLPYVTKQIPQLPYLVIKNTELFFSVPLKLSKIGNLTSI